MAPQVGEDLEEEPSLIWTECPGPPVPLLRSPGAARLTALHQDGGPGAACSPHAEIPRRSRGSSAQPAAGGLDKPLQMFLRPWVPGGSTVARGVGLGDWLPGDDGTSPDPRGGEPRGPTLTCPPSSNGPTWENHAREQNQVGIITVGPLEVNT